MPLTEKEAAALTRLEQERERRINEKIESGAAIRKPLVIVAAAGPVDVAQARKNELARLRKAGERREVYFDERVILTGVPRPGRDTDDDGNYSRPVSEPKPTPSICDRRSAGGAPAPFAVSEPQPTAPKQIERAESPVVRRVYVTVERPSETNPGGAIVEGSYWIEDGMVKVTDLQGRLLGTQPINPGDDAEAAARAVLRKKRGSAFYAPIQYPRRSMY
jgi:hypothetical protein